MNINEMPGSRIIDGCIIPAIDTSKEMECPICKKRFTSISSRNYHLCPDVRYIDPPMKPMEEHALAKADSLS